MRRPRRPRPPRPPRRPRPVCSPPGPPGSPRAPGLSPGWRGVRQRRGVWHPGAAVDGDVEERALRTRPVAAEHLVRVRVRVRVTVRARARVRVRLRLGLRERVELGRELRHHTALRRVRSQLEYAPG